jgi:hypothetical protein
MTLCPLSEHGKPPRKPEPRPPLPALTPDKTLPALTQPGSPAPAGPLAFYEQLGRFLRDDPPPASDAGLLGMFRRIGLSVEKGFDGASLDAATKRGLERALKAGEEIVIARAKQAGKRVNGWDMPPVESTGTWGTDYLLRAAIAWQSIFVNNPAEMYYPVALVDGAGRPLDGSKNRYVLRFEKGQLPPVEAFWSVTLYDAAERLMVENPIHRYAIGDRTPGLKYEPDGSLTLYIQRDSPGKERESNWLPAADGRFFLMLRAYLPKEAMLDGSYRVPAVERVE